MKTRDVLLAKANEVTQILMVLRGRLSSDDADYNQKLMQAIASLEQAEMWLDSARELID